MINCEHQIQRHSLSKSENKSSLLSYLCEKWDNDEEAGPQLEKDLKLFLAGGFRDATKSVLLTNGSISLVPELESNQEEADTRLLLHAVYATRVGTKRIVVLANDTDVVILSIYYFRTLLHEVGLHELWMKTEEDTYLPIHDIAFALDDEICRALPLLHSLSGRDTISYPYFTGKKAWLQKAKTVPLDHLARFAEDKDTFTLSNECSQPSKTIVDCNLHFS